MQENSSHILVGGIFTHLVNNFVVKSHHIWTKNDFGGSIGAHRSMPYMIFSKRETRPWRSVTFEGGHHQIWLEVYCGEVSLKQAKLYALDIIDALHGADFPLKGHALIEIQHDQAEYIKLADKNEFLVRLLFTVLTVAD